MRLGLTLALAMLIVTVTVDAEAPGVAFGTTLLVVCLIIGFAVAAAGWTINGRGS